MDRLELSHLATLLRDAAGEGEGLPLDESNLDESFFELGYDSLALLQTIGVIERDFEVTLDEEALDEADTPRLIMDLVNAALSARAAA
ncbi:acyl carrier protein [Streptomyces sp. NPDC001941]|uniref:acyl carrier protein n=1 Tax=Streptomyces sp. NPDC001941 TaxID=3154659 RepID=UPI0033188CE5